MGKGDTVIRSLQRKPVPDEVGLEQHGQTSLRGIATKARERPGHRFENLYGELNEELLRESWKRLNKAAASGVDRVTAREYAKDLDGNLERLVKRLKSKRYRARLVRRQWIPKGDGRERALGIPVLEDRLLQGAVALLLESIWEADFTESSFGYRRGRSAQGAARTLAFNLQFGRFGYVVEADIKGFFDHVSHGWLERMLRLRIDDEALVGLIGKWLRAGVLERDGEVLHPEAGTPQGGCISPVLSNIYLHHVLDLWFERVVKGRCRGRAMLIRYCDDFVCAFQYRSDAQAFYRALPGRLGKFDLAVSPEKTRIVRFSRFHPEYDKAFTFLGFEYRWETDRGGEPRVKMRTAREKLRASLRRFSEWIRLNRSIPLRRLMALVSLKLQGHYNYFGVHGNSRSLRLFHREVALIVFKWLNRRSQRWSYNWRTFWQMVNAIGLPLPRITEARRGPLPILG